MRDKIEDFPYVVTIQLPGRVPVNHALAGDEDVAHAAYFEVIRHFPTSLVRLAKGGQILLSSELQGQRFPEEEEWGRHELYSTVRVWASRHWRGRKPLAHEGDAAADDLIKRLEESGVKFIRGRRPPGGIYRDQIGAVPVPEHRLPPDIPVRLSTE